MRRSDPDGTTRSFFRAEQRIFALNGQWYFTTREGERGPFRSKGQAEQEADRYVGEVNELKHFQRSRQAEMKHAPHSVTGQTLEILPLDDSLEIPSLDTLVAELNR